MRLIPIGTDDFYLDLEKPKLPTLEFTSADPTKPILVCGNCGNTPEEARGAGHTHEHVYVWWPNPLGEYD